MNRNQQQAGHEMHALLAKLYPLCRSITGPGLRETLCTLQNYIPLVLHEVPTGTRVFDWTVPREWTIRDAYIKDPTGKRIVDFRACNLHVMNYSVPVHARMRLAELKPHLFSLPDRPDAIPYRTSYYAENWGFCLSHQQLQSLEDVEYEVCIDAELRDGHLTYGEVFIKGESESEVLFSCHVCHPSLANDNLSGNVVATWLARYVMSQPRRYSYRFLFVPATIGALAWLSENQSRVQHIKHGLVLTLLGDPGKFHYKRSRRGNAEIDEVVQHVLHHSGEDHTILDFDPGGYDERQYCSPGFNLPVGCLMRTPYGQFPEYHTSADNPDFVRPEALADSYAKLVQAVEVLEADRRYVNLHPYGEPQLGRRGLYKAIGGEVDSAAIQKALLWVLNFSDGQNSLLDIARRAGLPFDTIATAGARLAEHGLIAEVSADRSEKPS